MPEYFYSRYDPAKYLPSEEAFDRLAEFLLEHGDYVLRQLEHDEEMLRQLLRDGYLTTDEAGRLTMTPRGIRRVESKAVEEMFASLRRAAPGQHATELRGTGAIRFDESRPYQFGDPLAQLDLHATLRNALTHDGPSRGRLRIGEDDLVVHESDEETSCATVLLLDMSGSMARYGKFYHAKKVALAVQGLVRGRYRGDTLCIAGFATFALPLTERGLLHALPKPVSTFDSRVFTRVPLDGPRDQVPEHFTNIQAGLRFARHFLQRQPAVNKQIICITDGEPTAHLEGNELVLVYPPGDRTARATLAEVQACVRAGIQLSTLALIEDYFYLGLVNFVDQMARVAHGLAIYCKAGELGRYVLESFVRGRSARRHLG